MNKVLSGAEVCAVWSENGKRKGNLPLLKMFVLAVFAGVFIGLGGVTFLGMVSGSKGDVAAIGKLLGGVCFSMGLMLVVFFGAELFTGNCLMPIAVCDKKITVSQMIKNWVVVYIGNAVGSYLLAYIMYLTGLFHTEAMTNTIISVAQAKASLGFAECVSRGILCNILVCAGLWFQSASPDFSGKVLGMIVPISAFTFCGYEHCVANMFMIPLGQLMGAEVSTLSAWIVNIIPVTLGNIIGGALCVAVPMWWVYLKGQNK